MNPVLLKYDMGEKVMAFSTMRHGSVSRGDYSSFNITPYCGDDKYNIDENRKLLCDALNIKETNLFLPYQTHGVETLEIDDEFLFCDSEMQKQRLHAIDAIFTRKKNICIGVSTADCIPVLLYDECSETIAAIHAGWRGTVNRIVEKSIAEMPEMNPLTTKAVIAPGISFEAFEVGDEVYETFSAEAFPMDKISGRYGKKWHIDLREANRLQLLFCNIPYENIYVVDICTYNSYNDFFSARRLGIKSGRIFNGILMK